MQKDAVLEFLRAHIAFSNTKINASTNMVHIEISVTGIRQLILALTPKALPPQGLFISSITLTSPSISFQYLALLSPLNIMNASIEFLCYT